MSTAMVDTEGLLADALRVLLPLAMTDEPEWLPQEGAIARRKAYLAAQVALMAYDEGEPAAVAVLPVVVTEHPTPLAHLHLVAAP